MRRGVVMRVAHLLRKYNPREWGGTEAAVLRLCNGLRSCRVGSVVFAPKLEEPASEDPFASSGVEVKRYRAFLPVWGLGARQRQDLIYSGGNLMSLDLMTALWRETDLDLIHTHCQNRIGGIGLRIARWRHVPLVVSIHGGVLALPGSVREHLQAPLRGTFEWGKIFGLILRSRQLLREADAIITCNNTEARLLREKYPSQRILVQPHGVPLGAFDTDRRSLALRAFPEMEGKRVLLAAGRIDPVKNQKWLIEQMPAIVKEFPDVMLVLAGEPSDGAEALRREICGRGLKKAVLMTGGIPPMDGRLTGLFQQAQALVLPSINEVFGLVILEAWAAGIPVIASRNPGALDLVRDGENGWLFDLSAPESYRMAVRQVLGDREQAQRMGAAGRGLVRDRYDSVVLAGEIKELYRQLIGNKT